MVQEDDDLRSDSLVPVIIGGSERLVPRNEMLLACLQFLRPHAVMAGGFCGRAECGTCEVLVEYPGGGQERIMACRTTVVPGMRILELSAKLRVCLKDL